MKYKIYRISPARKVARAEHMLACSGEGGEIHLPDNGTQGWTCICEGTLVDHDCRTWPNHNLAQATVRMVSDAADVVGCRIDGKDVLGLLFGDIVVIQGERIKTRPYSGVWLHLACGELALNDQEFFHEAMEKEEPPYGDR